VASRSVITANNLVTFGQTVGNLPAVCGAGAATCTKCVRRRRILVPLQHVATAGWRRVRRLIPPIIGDAAMRSRSCRRRSYREHLKPQREGCSLLSAPPQASPSRRDSETAETSSSRNHRQPKFQWIHHSQQRGRTYGLLQCSKQVSQSRPLL
jgi:hypothetical protein